MNQIMVLYIMDNGLKMVIEKVKVYRFGKMAVNIKATGKQIKLMGRED